MRRLWPRFAILVLGFFALYALTAQRGAAWGDSAEFQDWVLSRSELVCGPHFSNAHPFYVGFCRAVADSPFAVTLVSALFGALSVGGLFLCTRRAALSALFGLSQMLWWLSTLAEVQTMSLAMTAFETWCLVRGAKPSRIARGTAWLCACALLSGLHLSVHNFALLSLPVYVFVLAVVARRSGSRAAVVAACPAVCWLLGASYWLVNLFSRGPADMLYGSYGAQVAGLPPASWTATAFNFGLAAVSFFVPVVIAWWERATLAKSASGLAGKALVALFAVNFLFFVRYFVPDQSQFLLPSLFYAYVLLRGAWTSRTRLIALAALQLLLPVFAYLVARELPQPADRRDRHPGRDDARYFILPWKV